MLVAEAKQQRHLWALALEQIASEVGEKSPLYKAMGSVAWGRYDGEPCPSDSKENALRGLYYLMGVRDALLRAAEIQRWDGLESLRSIHDRIHRMERH